VTRFLLNGILDVLIVVELSQVLADFYAALFFLISTVYWVSRDLLNDILIILNVAELSQALHDLYAR